jgi:hypothetical protein
MPNQANASPDAAGLPIRRAHLVGRWRLVSYTTGTEHPMGEGAVGVLQYSADGKVSVHIMGEGYLAYYGDYTVDEAGAAVTHHLELCSDPKLVGAANLRHARLEGTRLTLSGSMPIGGQARAIRVVWERDGN